MSTTTAARALGRRSDSSVNSVAALKEVHTDPEKTTSRSFYPDSAIQGDDGGPAPRKRLSRTVKIVAGVTVLIVVLATIIVPSVIITTRDRSAPSQIGDPRHDSVCRFLGYDGVGNGTISKNSVVNVTSFLTDTRLSNEGTGIEARDADGDEVDNEVFNARRKIVLRLKDVIRSNGSLMLPDSMSALDKTAIQIRLLSDAYSVDKSGDGNKTRVNLKTLANALGTLMIAVNETGSVDNEGAIDWSVCETNCMNTGNHMGDEFQRKVATKSSNLNLSTMPMRTAANGQEMLQVGQRPNGQAVGLGSTVPANFMASKSAVVSSAAAPVATASNAPIAPGVPSEPVALEQATIPTAALSPELAPAPSSDLSLVTLTVPVVIDVPSASAQPASTEQLSSPSSSGRQPLIDNDGYMAPNRQVGLWLTNRCNKTWHFSTAAPHRHPDPSLEVRPNEVRFHRYLVSEYGGMSVKIAEQAFDWLRNSVGVAQFEYNLGAGPSDRMWMDMSFVDCGTHKRPGLDAQSQRTLPHCPMAEGGWLAKWDTDNPAACPFTYCKAQSDEKEGCGDAYVEPKDDLATKACVFGKENWGKVSFELISCPIEEDMEGLNWAQKPAYMQHY